MLTILLAAFLLVIYPTLNLYLSLNPRKNKSERPRMHRYALMTVKTLVLLALLWTASLQAGYTPGALGLDFPVSSGGLWGLGIAALLFAVLGVLSLKDRTMTEAEKARHEVQLLESEIPWPRTSGEAIGFAVSMSLMTAAWELLYRGFLLLFLAPVIGMPLAVAASALAYGIGHGYKNPRLLMAAIGSAFAFTIAYALTHSLWWLILIHAVLPLTAIPSVLKAHRRREGVGAQPLHGQA